MSFLRRGHAAISRVTPSLCRGHATVSRRRNCVILAQGPCDSVQRKIRRQARFEVRTSRPALEGSIVSPLVYTMGGLSGGRRGGDVSVTGSVPANWGMPHGSHHRRSSTDSPYQQRRGCRHAAQPSHTTSRHARHRHATTKHRRQMLQMGGQYPGPIPNQQTQVRRLYVVKQTVFSR